MSNFSLTIQHALGATEAVKRIRAAADAQRTKSAGLVSNVTWTGDVARVEGTGFSGEIRVSEAQVVVNAELGFPASLMPMKAKKEAEAWLRGVLES